MFFYMKSGFLKSLTHDSYSRYSARWWKEILKIHDIVTYDDTWLHKISIFSYSMMTNGSVPLQCSCSLWLCRISIFHCLGWHVVLYKVRAHIAVLISQWLIAVGDVEGEFRESCLEGFDSNHGSIVTEQLLRVPAQLTLWEISQ